MGRDSSSGQRALLLLAVLAVCSMVPAAAAAGPSVNRRDDRLTVRGTDYAAAIDLAAGGRVASYTVDGVEITGLCEEAGGGLFVEEHTADTRFGVVEQTAGPEGAAVRLAASAGPLRVVKEYRFPAAGRRFVCRLGFENRSRFALGGGEAPALRHLVWPAGRAAAGRELFCLGRGRGAEVLSRGIFLGAVPGAGDGPLRWVAAADPTARRAAGFALLRGRVSATPPRRCPNGGTAFGWRYAPLPAGRRLEAEVLFCVLEGFAALSELNGRFAAESLPAEGTEGVRVRLRLAPIGGPAAELSVVTRTYGPGGAELGPLEALLFPELTPGEPVERETMWPGDPSALGWLVHEAYAGGQRLSRFAVPVGEAGGTPPVSSEPPPEGSLHELDDYRPVPPGGGLQRTTRAEQTGLQLWEFDGEPATRPLERLEVKLARDEVLTRFLGIRALGEVDVRVALAAPRQSAAAIPPTAVYLWRVVEPPDGPAWLTPLSELHLRPAQAAWLAITIDAGELQPGRSEALLIAEAEGRTVEVPLTATVLPFPSAPSHTFGLWYLPGPGRPALERGAAGALRRYGVGALTISPGEDYAQAGAKAAEHGLDRLAFTAEGGVFPPAATYPGRLLLPCPDPAWLLRAGGVSVRSLTAAAEAGYRPALLCERLDRLPPEMLGGQGGPVAYLVEDGVAPAVVPAMVRSGEMQGDEEIWLTLDLRGADWKRAAVSVRSAFWAAAWQGLAGAAVRCPPPSGELGRQLAIWHILRDARNEVAHWRRIRRLVREAGAQSAPRRLAEVETVVGPTEGCLLRLRERPAAFRTLYRVAGSGPAAPRLRDFAAARQQALAAWRPGHSRPGNLYWRGIPALADGRPNWAFVAEGGRAWRFASRLCEALTAEVGIKPPLRHGFLAGDSAEPALVWAVIANSGRLDWPGPLRSAIQAAPPVELFTVRLEEGPLVAVLRAGPQAEQVMRTFTSRPSLYETARHVQ